MQQPDNQVRIQFVLAGVGGQGVVFASRVLSEMALTRGFHTLSAENHGMAKRGGSVVTTMKIGSFKGPLIRQGAADVLLGFTREETLRNLPFLTSDGHCFVNTTAPLPFGIPPSKQIHCIDASSIAVRLGNPLGANLVLMGYAFGHPWLVLTADDLSAAVRAIVPERTLNANLRAVRAGVELAESRN